MAKPKFKAATIDDYLASVNAEQRAALEKLRTTIKAAVPMAEECISYGLAAFRLNGRPLVAFGAGKDHCAFYPMSGTTVAAFKKDLAKYGTSKGTIRFFPSKPLSAVLVKKLVKARIAENMVAKKHAAKTEPPDGQTDPAVESFLRELDHPLKKAIEAVRQVILGVSPTIREGIKWNAPSFRTTDYFATLNLRAKDGQERVWLILHLGAKVKDNTKELAIADPTGILQWLAKDRAMITVADAKDVTAKRPALAAIIRAWIEHLSS